MLQTPKRDWQAEFRRSPAHGEITPPARGTKTYYGSIHLETRGPCVTNPGTGAWWRSSGAMT